MKLYKTKHLKWIVLTGLVLLLIVSGTALAAGSYSIDWWTVDGGGETSSGGAYSLSATIGQPEAGGLSSGGNFTLAGGFWAAGSDGPQPQDSLIYLPAIIR